ncbi:hypothetical protein DPEC_G00296180 [Dallia pectoralis]|uniref:Uncharacterized protein n=1 Tax=Dallia pectoralis TaxID=75939 RepID=A0ACC2FIP3_DALPE|nr:hypothetical protein DPEC_G00296180 [Dallia pectoralis]
MKAASDAVEGMPSMFYEAKELSFAPDWTLDPMKVIKDIKGSFVDNLSDYKGNSYLSYIDPVIIGRGLTVNIDVVRRMFTIFIEQKDLLVDYLSNSLFGDQGIIPEINFDPRKAVTDAMFEIADRKNVFLAYLSNMIIDNKGDTTESAPDIHVIRKKGEFLPPLEKVFQESKQRKTRDVVAEEVEVVLKEKEIKKG